MTPQTITKNKKADKGADLFCKVLLFFFICVSSVEAMAVRPPVKYSDTTPPTGTITVNNGDAFTSSPAVSLALTAQDGASQVVQMQLSSDGSSWSPAEPFVGLKAWDLQGADGTKTVYVRYKDAANNWSAAFSDGIILDTTPPAVSISSPADGAMVAESQILFEGAVDGVGFSESRDLQEGENVLTKTAVDAAGNEGSASVRVYYDLGGSIGPAGGEVFSQDGKARLTIPPGALSEPASIEIVSRETEGFSGAVSGDAVLLNVVECKPYGLTFQQPVTLIYSMDSPEVPGTPVQLGLYDGAQGVMVPTGQTSTVSEDGYSVAFSIDHFSIYGALKNLIPSAAPIGGGVRIPLPDMFTGSFSYGFPIAVPPGRKGVQPALSLSYRSSNGNSWVGVGFSLNPGYIVRSTRLGPPAYDDPQDTFYLITDAGTTELVLLVDNLYQAKIESSFTRFYKEPDDSWRVINKDGSVLRFGQTGEAREAAAEGTFAWYLTRATDTNGNYIAYSYSRDQGKSYLGRVDYTGNDNGLSPTHSVEFILESRSDASLSYISGAKIVTARRLKEILVKIQNDPVWRYVLDYDASPKTGRSLVSAVTRYTPQGEPWPVQRFYYQESD